MIELTRDQRDHLKEMARALGYMAMDAEAEYRRRLPYAGDRESDYDARKAARLGHGHRPTRYVVD